MAILDDKIRQIENIMYNGGLKKSERVGIRNLLTEMKLIADSRLPTPVKKERCYNCWSNQSELILITEETDKGQTKELWCKNCISFSINKLDKNNTIQDTDYTK